MHIGALRAGGGSPQHGRKHEDARSLHRITSIGTCNRKVCVLVAFPTKIDCGIGSACVSNLWPNPDSFSALDHKPPAPPESMRFAVTPHCRSQFSTRLRESAFSRADGDIPSRRSGLNKT